MTFEVVDILPLRFLDIADLIGEVMSRHTVIPNPDVEQILMTEQWCYEQIAERCC